MTEKRDSLTTDTNRIRANLADWHEASSEYGYLMGKAQQAQAVMNRAIRNLEALGAHKEVEKLRACGQ